MDYMTAVQTLKEAGAFGRGVPLIPGTNVALLTKPGKMPGYSWSLPAGNKKNGQANGTCPGAVFGPLSQCGSCYANADSIKLSKHGVPMRRGGSYGYPVTVNAQAARVEWTQRCLMTKEGMDEWVETMVAAITWAAGPVVTGRKLSSRTRRIPYFRVHDSGDIFNPKYGQMWDAVIARLPHIKFWIPTRSYHNLPRVLPVLQQINARPNASVRPSALWIAADPPVIPGLAAGTGSAKDGYTCPSSHQDGKCMDCRACWGKDRAVVYRLH